MTTYIVTVSRAAGPPASLTALTVTPGSLDPPFSSTEFSYTVALAHDVGQITIVATPAGAGIVAVTEPPLGGLRGAEADRRTPIPLPTAIRWTSRRRFGGSSTWK